jgi:PhoPQ-activated pathogenicity-related protein
MLVAELPCRPLCFAWLALGLLWMLIGAGPDLAWGQAAAPPIPPALAKYLARPEPKFEWKLTNRLETPFGKVHQLRLVSQEWHDLVWEHDLHVYVPPGAKPQATMLLWNQGGSGSEKNMLFGIEMARRVGAPIAFLYQIPNQPLFEGKKEDALIAETFVRYLETGDDSWPLLFPMVKSLVKAMDALQAHAQAEWQHEIKNFVVSGASKRGWTTWLTGASDPRVKAIAPLVIDTLNMREQGPYQLKSFGAYSEQVHDYTERKLLPMPDTPQARALWTMVDPWVYREKLKLPKFILNGANDPYWTTDALNLYWSDLPGEKWVLYVPNAGHGLEQNFADGSKNRDRALNGLAAFTRHMIRDNPLPTVEWKHSDDKSAARLVISCNPAPRGARVWVARAGSRDFRQAAWKETTAVIEENQVQISVAPSATEVTALFGEVDFEIDGLVHQFSTQMRILDKQP